MNDSLNDKTILVLGAGATRAFAPKAPLVEDDYGLERLLNHFRGFPYAFQILENERHRRNGKINVEQLMTRLYGRMPYDTEDARAQQGHLLSEVMKEFTRRISLARQNGVHSSEQGALARLIVKGGVNCITFNYDDILDEALWKESEAILEKEIGGMRGRFAKLGKKYWHPDGGYGFFVRSSDVTIHEGEHFMDKTSMLLLKLHGSINWHPRSGERQPYSIDAILHDEQWYPHEDYQLIARHLENDPFLVPPVLDKTALGSEPVLKTVWSLAKQYLELASRVYFVGYSMPAIDLAGSFLFSETLGSHVHRIHVVNLASQDTEKEQIKTAYRKVFPEIKDDQFEFDGALAWVKRVCGQESPQEA